MPGDVITSTGGHDAQRYPRRGDDVDPQVHHAVPANDDQRLNVTVRSVSQEGPAGTARLVVGATTYVEDLVPSFAQDLAGDVVGGRVTPPSRRGIGQQSNAHEVADTKVRKKRTVD